MEDDDHVAVELHVDPSCPFAWIASRWLGEVEQQRSIDVQVRLLSLAVVNEGRDLDEWYRGFNDAAWAPARVMAAVERAHGFPAGRRFYDAFGERFHGELDTADDVDRVSVAERALAEAGLPGGLLAAATDATHDEALRVATRAALGRVGLDVGVPVVVIDGVAASGPVLTQIPRGRAAVELLGALRALARQPGFVRVERARAGALQTT